MSGAAKPRIEEEISIDLHGLSIEAAKALVLQRLKELHGNQIYKATIITGRGIHRAKDKKRGKIFKSLPGRLKPEDTMRLIQELHKHVRHCLVHLLPSRQIRIESRTRQQLLDSLLRAKINIKDLQTRAKAKDITAMADLKVFYYPIEIFHFLGGKAWNEETW